MSSCDTYPTRTAAIAATIPSSLYVVQVRGVTREGDAPPHFYSWQATQPLGPASSYWADQSSRGGYWMLAETLIDLRYLGAAADYSTIKDGSMTAGQGTVTSASGGFANAVQGQIIGIWGAGAITCAIYRFRMLSALFLNTVFIINGSTFTGLAATSGASGAQFNNGTDQYSTAANFVTYVNNNSSTLKCTAMLSGDLVTLTASNAGTAGNSMTFSVTGSVQSLIVRSPVFFGGGINDVLVGVIGSVTSSNQITLANGVTATATVSGAQVDFGTDNAATINAAISLISHTDVSTSPAWSDVSILGATASNLTQRCRGILRSMGEGSGEFGVSSPVIMYPGADLDWDAQTHLGALPNFSGDSVVYTVQTTPGGSDNPSGVRTAFYVTLRNAYIACRGYAIRGIYCRQGSYWNLLGRTYIFAPLVEGMRLDGVVHYVENFFAQANKTRYGTNDPLSLAMHMPGGDSQCNRLRAVGFRTGLDDRAGDNVFLDCHAWTGPGLPMTCGYSIYSSTSWFGRLYCDTPGAQNDPTANTQPVYGLYAASDVHVDELQVYLNASEGSADNETTAFYTASSTGYMTLIGRAKLQADPSLKYKTAFDGMSVQAKALVEVGAISSPSTAYYALGTVQDRKGRSTDESIRGEAFNADFNADFIGQVYRMGGSRQAFTTMVSVSRSAVAYAIDANGVWQSFATNTPRETSAGLLIEPNAVTNKVAVYSANAMTSANFGVSGSGVLSVVNDTAALAAAGLQNICTSGNVYKLDNSGSSSQTEVVLNGGTTGKQNPHSISAYIRGSGGGILQNAYGTVAQNITPTSAYTRFEIPNFMPYNTSDRLAIKANAGAVIYFILPQLEEAPYVSSPIVTMGAAATRPAEIATFALPAGTFDVLEQSQNVSTWLSSQVVLAGFVLPDATPRQIKGLYALRPGLTDVQQYQRQVLLYPNG